VSAGSVHVALLRGINLGARNKLPMRNLVGMFQDAGCDDVRSYIRSGNVVYRAKAPLARRIPALLRDELERRFGYDVPVVGRTAAEFRKCASAHPFAKRGVDPQVLLVAFLAERPSAAALRALDPDRSPGDEFRVRGREIYLYTPGGFARTKLSNAWFESRLSATSTIRNWRTVQKLVELTERP
jgi:uncharacterized protein (DUF1697 family)